ncbi:MAG: hypothetical protein ABIL01_17200 [Pseudomonadota bacterium]
MEMLPARTATLAQTPLSSPGLAGRPSIPEAFEINREAAAYWIARSSRATTTLIVAVYLRHCEELLSAEARLRAKADATKQSIYRLIPL